MDDYRDVDDEIVERLKAKLNAYNKAAKKFLDKVDSGNARSVETYRELKAAYNLPEDVSGYKL